MATEEELVARLRAEGQSAFGRAMRSAAGQVRAVGDAQTFAGRSARGFTRSMRESARQASSASISFGTVAKGYAAYRIADAFRAATASGFEFNRMQDRQRVGFTALLGTEAKAASMMREIQALALRSPVLNPAQTGDAARAMIAYGVPVKDVLGDVERLGNMSAASGKSISEAMPLGARALGQIAARGSLAREELNQLADSVGLGQEAIRKQLGMTRKEFADRFQPGNLIPAAQALPAIRRAMEKQSAGAAENLAKTTEGKMDAARERLARGMGRLTRPLYDRFGDAIGVVSKDLDRIWRRKDLDVGERLKLSRDAVRRTLDPMREEFSAWWKREHVGESLSDAVEAAAPKLLNAAGDAGRKAVTAFARAWWDAGPWGKLITAALIGKRLGLFGAMGRGGASLAASGFKAAWKRAMVGRAAATVAAEGMADSLPGAMGARQGRINRTMRGKARLAGRAFGLTFGLAVAGAVALELTKTEFVQDLAEKIGTTLGLIDPKDERERRDRKTKKTLRDNQRTTKREFGPHSRTGPPIVIPDGPRRKGKPKAKGASVSPNARPGARASLSGDRSLMHLEVPVKVGRRELGRASADIAADDLARA